MNQQQSTLEKLPEQRRDVLVLFNPKSGSSNRAKLVEKLAEELSSRGFSTKIFSDVDKLIARASEQNVTENLRTVVAAGGDGTVSFLINRLPADVPVTVFPLGTANLLAKFLNAKADIKQIADRIERGNTIRLDVGRANEHLFVVVASCGFDADVVHRIHSVRSGHINYWSYGLPIIRAILGYRFPELQLEIDAKRKLNCRWAFVLNVPRYAIGLNFVGEASANDGKLNLCTFSRGGFFYGLFYFVTVLFRLHPRWSGAELHSFSTLKISGPPQTPVQLDGDPSGFCPAEIQVLPGRMRVIAEGVENQINDDVKS